jgi:hypothetical protein
MALSKREFIITLWIGMHDSAIKVSDGYRRAQLKEACKYFGYGDLTDSELHTIIQDINSPRTKWNGFHSIWQKKVIELQNTKDAKTMMEIYGNEESNDEQIVRDLKAQFGIVDDSKCFVCGSKAKINVLSQLFCSLQHANEYIKREGLT